MIFPEASEQRRAEIGARFEAWLLAREDNLHPDEERWLRTIGSQLRANADAWDEFAARHIAHEVFCELVHCRFPRAGDDGNAGGLPKRNSSRNPHAQRRDFRAVGLSDVLAAISHPDFETFRRNLDAYEAFGDYGAKPTHPGTNLVGPNAALAAESIFVRQYRAALVLLGRIASPDMTRGAAQPSSLAQARTNTRPGVYAIFVGAAINHIGIYKLGLDKVHSDYGGVPMKLAPGSRLENDASPVVDAWRCNQTLGEIADTYYLSDPPSAY